MTTTQDLWGTMTQVSLTFKTIVCGGCGIPFGIPENYYNKLIESHGSFYCPNGCSRQFTGETEEEKLLRRLRMKENELAQAATSKIQLENQLNKANKKLSKVAQGQCPCCDKTYKYLASHISKKHPEFKKQ